MGKGMRVYYSPKRCRIAQPDSTIYGVIIAVYRNHVEVLTDAGMVRTFHVDTVRVA